MMGLCFRRTGYSVSVNPSKRQDADVAVVRVVVVLAASSIRLDSVKRSRLSNFFVRLMVSSTRSLAFVMIVSSWSLRSLNTGTFFRG